MKVRLAGLLAAAGIFALLFAGCATTGAGYTGTRTGFLSDYGNLKGGDSGLPDYYYASPNADLSKYKKVLVADFSAISTQDVSFLYMDAYKNIGDDLAKAIAQACDGTMFDKCEATNTRVRYNDMDAIKKLPADAVILGNFAEFKENGGLGVLHALGGRNDGQYPADTKVEIKIVDTKTGKEVVGLISENAVYNAGEVTTAVVPQMMTLLRKVESTSRSAASQ
ncbi:MAG: hypothetical protein ACYDFU_01825 [Nitrospirota bacterium]